MAGLMEKDQVGVREDLADYITNIDVHNTPFSSRVPRGKKMVNVKADWQVDAYPAPRYEGVLDGKDAAEWEDLSARAELTGRAQKFWRLPAVSDFAENVSDVAGLGQRREMAEMVRKAFVMLKRDMEVRFCASALEAQVDTGSVPNETRSLGVWIQSTAQSLYPVPAAFRTPAASIDTTATASVTEATLKTVLKSQWTQVGASGVYDFIMGTDLKAAISTFSTYEASGITDLRRVTGKANQVVQMVDLVKNDFGTMRMHLSNYIGADTAYGAFRGYVLDFDKIELRWNRMPRVVKIDDGGGGPRSIVDAIVMLVVKNPLGLAKFNATS